MLKSINLFFHLYYWNQRIMSKLCTNDFLSYLFNYAGLIYSWPYNLLMAIMRMIFLKRNNRFQRSIKIIQHTNIQLWHIHIKPKESDCLRRKNVDQ